MGFLAERWLKTAGGEGTQASRLYRRTGILPNSVALAAANDLARAGTVSPSGPREWLANGRTMNLRSGGLDWQGHSHLIRRTVAENGPCHAAATGAKQTVLGILPVLRQRMANESFRGGTEDAEDTCITIADPARDFESRDQDCFRCSCEGCRTKWETRLCSKGHRDAAMLPSGVFVDTDDQRSG